MISIGIFGFGLILMPDCLCGFIALSIFIVGEFYIYF